MQHCIPPFYKFSGACWIFLRECKGWKQKAFSPVDLGVWVVVEVVVVVVVVVFLVVVVLNVDVVV